MDPWRGRWSNNLKNWCGKTGLTEKSVWLALHCLLLVKEWKSVIFYLFSPPTHISSDVTGIETSNLLVSSLAFLTILDEPLDSALMIVHNGYNIWRNPILLTDLAASELRFKACYGIFHIQVSLRFRFLCYVYISSQFNNNIYAAVCFSTV